MMCDTCIQKNETPKRVYSYILIILIKNENQSNFCKKKKEKKNWKVIIQRFSSGNNYGTRTIIHSLSLKFDRILEIP